MMDPMTAGDDGSGVMADGDTKSRAISDLSNGGMSSG